MDSLQSVNFLFFFDAYYTAGIVLGNCDRAMKRTDK